MPFFSYPHSWTDVRAADVFDILFVAILTYSAIVWLRQARSRFVLIGLGIMAGLYGLALLLEMRVTLVLFQTGIAVSLIALVVIFQEEIRRFFERMATTGLLTSKDVATGRVELVKVLLEAVPELAKKRIGALIVIKGKEPLERHLTGGVDLDGKPSVQALYSIFDTGSAGHDGAVIVEGGQIRTFGAHLPLSTSVEGDAPFGTRHTAALGLAERSDALVIVVSEERGEISIARHGKLTVLPSPAALRGRLKVFFRELSPAGKRDGRWRVTNNLGAKILALVVAAGAWLIMFNLEGDIVSRTFTVPIALRDVPDNTPYEEPDPLEIHVTLSGPERTLQKIDASRLVVLAAADDLRPGPQRIPINERDIQIPPGLNLVYFEPRTFTLVIPDRIAKEISVRPRTMGRLQPPLKLINITVAPEKVILLVPRHRSEAINTIRTEPINLSTLEETTTFTRALILPSDVRLPRKLPPTVEVTIKVATKRR